MSKEAKTKAQKIRNTTKKYIQVKSQQFYYIYKMKKHLHFNCCIILVIF